MSNETITPQVDVVESSHLGLIHKAEIDIQISTAKAFPRSLDLFMKDAISMVSVSPDIAEKCVYKLPRGGKSVEGPSVRLAEIVMACYGNISAGARIVANDGRKITAEGVCIDTQRNVRITKEVQARITNKEGITYNDDMQIVTGNASASKAMRNAIFTVVPTVFVSQIMEHAKKVARGDEKTLPQRRDAAIDWYRKNGATDAMLCSALGIRNVKDITLDHLESLSGWKVAASEGETGTLRDRVITILRDASGQGEESNDRSTLIAELEAHVLDIEPSKYNAMMNILEKNEVGSFGKVRIAIEEVNQKQ